MGAGLSVHGERVREMSRVVTDAGASLNPAGLRTAGASVSASLPGAFLGPAAVTVFTDMGEAVGRLATVCATWEQDVAAALVLLSEIDDQSAAELRALFARERPRAV